MKIIETIHKKDKGGIRITLVREPVPEINDMEKLILSNILYLKF